LDLTLKIKILLPPVRSSSSNLKLEEVAEDRGPSNWAPKLEGAEPQHPPLVGGR